MKHYFFSFVAIMLLAISSQSVQAEDKKDFGIRAGYQRSGLFEGSDRVSGTSNYASFYVGAFREKKILSFLYWGTGLEYCQNGAGLTDNNKHIIKYLGLPVDLKAKFGPVYAVLGVQPKFKLSEKLIINDEKITPTDEQKSTFMDFPAFGGIGFNILFVSVEARYHYGMFETNHGARNAYLQIGATLHF